MWCPKCKNEYRAGITVCADCKIPLVEALDESKENAELLHAFAEEAEAKKLISYLEYSGIAAHDERLEEEQLFAVFVDKKDYKRAHKAFAAFFTVETAANYEKLFDQTAKQESAKALSAADADAFASQKESGTSAEGAFAAKTADADGAADPSGEMPYEDVDPEDEKSSGDEEMMEEIRSAVSFAKQGSYVSKAEKSADYRSSAITFTLFGVVGILVMGLHWAGVFHFFSTLSSVIITILFVGFLFVGIDSFFRAKKAKAESVEEEHFIRELKGWLEGNLTYEMLTAADLSDQSKEENFLNEMNEMKRIIEKQFGALDPAFLEQFTEEYYNEHFEN